MNMEMSHQPVPDVFQRQQAHRLASWQAAAAKKPIDQFNRGLLTLAELINALTEIMNEREAR